LLSDFPRAPSGSATSISFLPWIMSGRARDVGSGEVFALEQQGFARGLGERVGEHVAEIESGRVAAFAIAAEGSAGDLELLGVAAMTSAPVSRKKRSSRSRPGSPLRPSMTRSPQRA
jgi:hypothetical protein